MLSHYRVLERLGSGGMGEVYVAEDTRLGRKVALKVPPAELLHQPLQLERFRREARALAAVSHPNVVTIYSVEEHEGLPFLSMALVEGKTLAGLIPPRGMGSVQLLEIAVQLADGLAAAHEHGVLHRDLKPGNLMVGAEGRVTILDFGIAKRLSPAGETVEPSGEAEPLTQEGNVVGTVAYMSPEQIRRQPLGPCSDLFSLGVVLYQMATGVRPFRGSDTTSEMLAILERPARPPSEIRADLGARFDGIVLRCLEKEPRQRYPSARALRQDLADLLRELNPSSGTAAAAMRSAGTRESAARPIEEEATIAEWGPTSGARSSNATSQAAAAAAWESWPPSRSLPAGRRRPFRSAAAAAALALLLAAGGWYAARNAKRSGSPAPAGAASGLRPAISALAVLPLHNLSGDPEYFADGMTEALISSLGNLGRVRVISRQSVMRYKDSDKPLPSIANELGVDVVLTGTVTRSGGSLRITTQLVRAHPEQQIWSAIFSRDARDVLALQDDVAREVAQQVRLELTDQEKARLTDARPVDPAVYDLYLQGRFSWNKRTPEGLHQAVDYFQRAIAADPTYASAYAGLADSYNLLGYLGHEPREESFRQARAAASRALALEGSLAEAHDSMGLVLLLADWDRSGAERAFRKALEINPSNATAHHWLAMDLLSASRLDEAARHLRIARQLDPFSSMIVVDMAVYAHMMGDYEGALEQARKAVELEPRLGFAHEQLWTALHAKGRWAEAFEEFKQTLSLWGYAETARRAAQVYAKSGYRAALGAACDHLEKSRHKDEGGWLVAEAAALAGDRERAIAELEKAVQRREPFVLWLEQMGEWQGLRGDRRFEDLVRRVRTRATDAPPAPAALTQPYLPTQRRPSPLHASFQP
jgi:TolB-like protein/Tfp pilus assembly protein PilF